MPNTGGTGTVDSGARGRNGITIPCSGNPPLWARTWAKYPSATVIAITHTRMRIKVTVPEAGFIGDLLKVFRLLWAVLRNNSIERGPIGSFSCLLHA
jgi:hypothetical protein